ncbi:MAG: bifunctional folylpolyglutamate synthase/dihydrofolate synthase [Ktedonobacterales bacterium]|nr:bifunctional folylpolyglutamate synthase/dihydrofolate synthase [Ktedonobacterales bacterium]
MEYSAALAYLYHFSDFERTGAFARDPEGNLRRMRTLLALLGDPHLAYPTTHIAGTKGKGSTAVLVAAAISASGIPTGLYTQPDLHTFRERIQIDGTPISEAEVAALVSEIQAAVGQLAPADAAHLITFEIGTVLAFLAFARRGVAQAVIEVGLGGRLDPTNVIAPQVGVITSISLDHTAILGDTIAAIAGEKAGIIKPGMTVVTSAQDPAAVAVITATCGERGATLVRVGPFGSGCAYEYDAVTVGAPLFPAEFTAAEPPLPAPFAVTTPAGTRELQTSFLGQHQRQNATAALATLEALRVRGVAVTDAGIRAGFLAARWPARMDLVGARPWLVVDGAHNADSLDALLRALATTFAYERLILVFGTMTDKDIDGMVQVVCQHQARLGAVITTQGQSPRATPARDLLTDFVLASPPVLAAFDYVGDALTYARQLAAPEDLICLTGSLALAGEALRWIRAAVHDPLAQRIVIAGNDHP